MNATNHQIRLVKHAVDNIAWRKRDIERAQQELKLAEQDLEHLLNELPEYYRRALSTLPIESVLLNRAWKAGIQYVWQVDNLRITRQYPTGMGKTTADKLIKAVFP